MNSITQRVLHVLLTNIWRQYNGFIDNYVNLKLILNRLCVSFTTFCKHPLPPSSLRTLSRSFMFSACSLGFTKKHLSNRDFPAASSFCICNFSFQVSHISFIHCLITAICCALPAHYYGATTSTSELVTQLTLNKVAHYLHCYLLRGVGLFPW